MERATAAPAITFSSTFSDRPAYKYVRKSDRLPTYENLPDEGADQTICRVKLFNPTGAGTWWLASVDDDGVAFGVAEIHERELGTVWLPELIEFRGRFGLPIERDLYFRPTSAAEILAGGGR